MSDIQKLFEDPDNHFQRDDVLYEKIGLGATPVVLGSKKPAAPGWTKHGNLTGDDRCGLRAKFPKASIGVVASQVLPNGNLFGFADVDRDALTEFARRVVNSPSGKVGQKAGTFFCQFAKGTKSEKIRQKGASAPVVEIMASSGMTVLPPSPHPAGFPYRWLGTPLYEMNPCDLPLVTGDQIRFLREVATREASLAIAEGGASVQAHDHMLNLTSSGIANLDLDLEWMAYCLNGLLPPGYSGDTASETLGMLRSAREKRLGLRSSTSIYDPGRLGPIPLGYLSDGRFVFFEQPRRLLIVETSTRMMSIGTLLNLAPVEFWQETFPDKKGINVGAAAISLMTSARARGGFDEGTVRGRGVYIEKGRVIRNFGDEVPPGTEYAYVCPIPLRLDPDGAEVEPAAVLKFLQLFNFASPTAPYLLLGWLVSAVISGALDWRTHVFLTGAKNTGKTTLVNAMRDLLDKIVVALDGTSTEAGIRQKLGADSRPVMLDEFEADQNLGRMRSVVKLVRSASSGNLAIARGTPDGKALEFAIRASFLLAAINAMAVTAADRSRIVTLSLQKHDNDKARAREIAELSQRFDGASASWCLRVIGLTEQILASIKTLQRVFPPCDSRHALNMSTLLGSAWTMLNGREIDDACAEALIEEHLSFIQDLGEAHESDDATECLNALLQYPMPADEHGRLLGEALATLFSQSDTARRAPQKAMVEEVARLGIKWQRDGIVVANSHRGLTEAFRGTQWEAGNWGSSLRRLPGATSTSQKRFADEQRSLGTFIPRDLIPKIEDPGGEF